MGVLAGTPEWFDLPLINFYAVVKDACLPLFLMGVGYIDAPISFRPDELYCLRNLAKIIITRDEYAARALQEAGVSSHILPCPALFASLPDKSPPEIKRIGFIIQASKTLNQSIPQDLTDSCVHAVNTLRSDGWHVDVICHYIDEFTQYCRSLSPVRYSYDARDYIGIINDYDLIVSTRLHGAVLANSLGRPAILLNNDARCRGAASLFPFIYPSTPEGICDQIASLKINEVKKLPSWKAHIKEKYLYLLRKAFADANLGINIS
jgi:polysaccharide pyruvyl transferase WcaK-like protein